MLISVRIVHICDEFRLGGKSGKFCDIGCLGSDEHRRRFAAPCCHEVTMAPRDFANKSMRAQQSEVAAGGGAAAAVFLGGARRAGKQYGLEIGVAQAFDGKLAAVDQRQHRGIFRREWIECAIPTPLTTHGLGQWRGGLPQRPARGGRGQRLQVTRVGGPAHLRARLGVRDGAAQPPPTLRPAFFPRGPAPAPARWAQAIRPLRL